MITDVIREAETEHVIYFLLTAYVRAVRFDDKVKSLPEQATRLPLRDVEDVSERFQMLVTALDAASRQANDKARTIIKEALHIFGTGLSRLKALQPERPGTLVGGRAHARRLIGGAAKRFGSPLLG